MATKTLYLTETLSGATQMLALQDGGSAPNSARMTTGWVVGTATPTLYARMDSQTERASNQHTSTAQPDGNPDNTLGDCFVVGPLTGTFANANWSFSFEVQGESRTTSTHDGRLRIRMYRSAAASGTSPTEITGAVQTTSAYTDLANSARQTLTLTYNPGSVTLTNEYLLIQVAHELTGAGNNVNSDVHLCTGGSNSITTSDFTPVTQDVTISSLIGSGESVPAPNVAFVINGLTLISGSPTVHDPTISLTVTVDNSVLFFSPGNWIKNGSTYAQTNNPGAYIKAAFVGTGASINLDASMWSYATKPIVSYRIDGGSWSHFTLTQTNPLTITMASGLSNAAHTFEFTFRSMPGNFDRWNTPSNVIRVLSVTVTGSSISLPTLATKRWIFFGDSITEGVNALSDAYGPAAGNSTMVFGRKLSVLRDAEFGIVGFVSQGWTTTGNGNVPVFHSGDGTQTWDKHWAGQSRSFSGIDAIILHVGTNDAASAVAAATVEARCTDFLLDFRAANPDVAVYLLHFAGGFASHRTALTNALVAANISNAYLISTNDPDLEAQLNNDGTFNNTYSWDDLHPSDSGHTRFADDLDAVWDDRYVFPGLVAASASVFAPIVTTGAVGVTADYIAASDSVHAPVFGGASNGLLNNLVAYWGLDEAGGANNALDKHSGARTLTQTASPGSDTGKVYSGARTFNGTSQYFLRASEASLSPGDEDFTIAAWLYPTDVSGTPKIINKASGDYDGFYIDFNGDSTYRFLIGFTSDYALVEATNFGTVPTNTWALLVCWHDAVNNQIGISVNNGTANTTAATSGVTTNTTDFRVGARPGAFFAGRIGPVCMWKSSGGGGVLTADQRTALWNDGAGLAYAEFDNGASAQNVTADFIAASNTVYAPTVTQTAAGSAINDTTVTAQIPWWGIEGTLDTGTFDSVITAQIPWGLVLPVLGATGGQNVTAGFIGSEASVATPTVTPGAISVTADYIASSEAVYALADVEQTVTPDFIASGEAVYDLADVEQTITPDAIGSGESVYTPTVTPGAVSVTADAIASGETVYAPLVATDAVYIYPDYLTSAESHFQPIVTRGAVTVTPDTIASTESVFAPTVSPGVVTVTADYIASGENVYTPTVTRGVVAVTADAIASSESIYAPAVTAVYAITADFVAASDSVHAPTVSATYSLAPDLIAASDLAHAPVVAASYSVAADFVASAATSYDPTVTPGAVTVTADFIASGESVAQPIVTTGGLFVLPDTVASGESVPIPTIWLQTQYVTPTAVGETSQVYTPTVTPGAAAITADFVGSAETLYQPSVTPAVWPIAPNGIDSTATVYNPAVAPQAVTVSLQIIAASDTVFAPVVSPQGVTSEPDFVTSAATVYAPTLLLGGNYVLPNAVPSGAQVYSPVLVPGAVEVLPEALGSAASVPAIVLAATYTIAAAFVAASDTISAIAVSVGSVTLAPSFISGSESVPQPQVGAGAYSLQPDFLAGEATLYSVVVTGGSVTIAPALIASGVEFWSLSVLTGPVSISVDNVIVNVSIYQPDVWVGLDRQVGPTFVTSVAQVFAVALLSIPKKRVRKVSIETRTLKVKPEI